jgi:uncharacterized protein (TIGR03382 family)
MMVIRLQKIGALVLALLGALGGSVLLPAAARAFTIDQGTLHFGNVAINTTATLSNGVSIDSGFSYLGAGGISGLNPPFHFSSTCTSASIGTCTFDESFTPTATGDFGGFLTLSECSVGGGFCLNTEVNFTGKGVDRIVGAVDEPSAAALLVLGLAALRRRRRGRRA